MNNYQERYSLINPEVLNKKGRIQKAKKIQCILNDYLTKNYTSGIILDIGCSGGIILDNLSITNSQKIGIDIDFNALKIARTNHEIDSVDFICADGMNLPFRPNIIAITLCNHVYEHLPDSEKLFQEIFRTLKQGGVCYCAAGNALAIMEPHYNLPFLSCIPKKFAHYYLKQMNRGTYYYENLLTWWSFKKIILMFRIHDYTIRIIREPELFASTDLIKPGSWITRIPTSILILLFPFIPTWILMLEKPRVDQD